jgi:hypothetical protein
LELIADWACQSATVTLIVCEHDIIAQNNVVVIARALHWLGINGNALCHLCDTYSLPNSDRVSDDVGFPFHNRLPVRLGRSIVPTVRPIKAAGMVDDGAVVWRTSARRLGSTTVLSEVTEKPAASGVESSGQLGIALEAGAQKSDPWL